MDESLVVGRADARRPLDQLALVPELFDPQVAAFEHAFGDTLDAFRNFEGLRGQVAGNEVHFLFEAERLDQFGVIGVVVIHHRHHLAMLKAQHLDAVAIERRETFGTDQCLHAAFPRPVKDRSEERARNGLVVHTFEERELRFFGLVIFVEGFVHARADTTHVFTVADGEEEVRFGVTKEGMLLTIERQVRVHEKRRHPLRTVLVKLVRKFHKPLNLLLVAGIHFFDGEHDGTPQTDLNPVYNKLRCARRSNNLMSRRVGLFCGEGS